MARTDGRARRGGHGRWKVKPLALLLFFFSTLAYADLCADHFANLHDLDPGLANAYQQLKNIDQHLLDAKATPGWEDFNKLDKILTQIRQGKKNVAQAGKDLELKAVLEKMAATAKDQPQLVRLGAPRPKLEPGLPYLPTEYELRLLYQRKLLDINRELPKNLKFPIARIPFDHRRRLLQEDTPALMRGLQERFDKLIPTSGYQNMDELKAAQANAGERAQKVNEIFEKEQIDIVMYRPQSARFWTPKVGFHNQHVTGSSGGFFGPDGRNNVEASLLGLSAYDLKAMDNELKPKYATFIPKLETGLKGTVGAGVYGQDLYVFKLNSIRDRLTITPGDSLNRHYYFNPNCYTTVSKLEDWDMAFIPWKNRALVAPEFYPMGEIWNTPYRGAKSAWNEAEANALKAFKRKMPENYSSYPEAQIFGPLSLDDVAEFRFTDAPPAGDFLRELQRRNIKIMDARRAQIVPWEPAGAEAGK